MTENKDYEEKIPKETMLQVFLKMKEQAAKNAEIFSNALKSAEMVKSISSNLNPDSSIFKSDFSKAPIITKNPDYLILEQLSKNYDIMKKELEVLTKKYESDREYFQIQLAQKNEELDLIKIQIKENKTQFKRQISLLLLGLIVSIITNIITIILQ
jgi:hypothetical protein